GGRGGGGLPPGLGEDHDPAGPGDKVAACLRPGVVLAQTTAARDDPNHDRLAGNVGGLRGAGGEVIEIALLPARGVGGQRVVVPPTNLYLARGAAIVPVVDGPEGEAALAALAEALPDREVVGVDSTVLAYGGGGVHCITQQVPR